MPKICINKPVKYNDTHYPSHTPFEVGDSDVSYFTGIGGWIVKEAAVEEPVTEEETEEPVEESVTEETKLPKKTTRKKASK